MRALALAYALLDSKDFGAIGNIRVMKTNALRLIPSPFATTLFWLGSLSAFLPALYWYTDGEGIFLICALLAVLLGAVIHHGNLAPRYGRAFRFQDWEGAWQEPTILGAGAVDVDNGYLVSRDWRGREMRRWPLIDLTGLDLSFRARRGFINWEFRFQFGAQSFVVHRSFYCLELHHSHWFFRSPRKLIEEWFVALPVIRDRIYGLVRSGIELQLARPYAELHQKPLQVKWRPEGLMVNGEAVATADLLIEGRGDAPDVRLATPKGIGFLSRQDRQDAGAYALTQILALEMNVKEIPTRKWWNRHLSSFLRI